jgi:hypothetical protein
MKNVEIKEQAEKELNRIAQDLKNWLNDYGSFVKSETYYRIFECSKLAGAWTNINKEITKG